MRERFTGHLAGEGVVQDLFMMTERVGARLRSISSVRLAAHPSPDVTARLIPAAKRNALAELRVGF
jgi:hypothetical protein